LKEYDVYVPLTYSDGRLIETEKLAGLKDLLLGVFGGLTFFPQENEGTGGSATSSFETGSSSSAC